jgi:hypothetical protein
MTMSDNESAHGGADEQTQAPPQEYLWPSVDVSEAETVTREEVEQRIRALGLRCRGPNKHELSPRDWQRLAPDVQDALAEVLPRRGAGEPRHTVRELISELLAAGQLDEARALDEFSRIRCGRDFADTVLANPLDGRRYSYECPDCGLTGVYDAPTFNVLG